VDTLAELSEDEALEWLGLTKVPAGWANMSWQSLAESLLNRVGEVRDDLVNG